MLVILVGSLCVYLFILCPLLKKQWTLDKNFKFAIIFSILFTEFAIIVLNVLIDKDYKVMSLLIQMLRLQNSTPSPPQFWKGLFNFYFIFINIGPRRPHFFWKGRQLENITTIKLYINRSL